MANYLFIGYREGGLSGELHKIKGVEPTEKEIRRIFEESGSHYDMVDNNDDMPPVVGTVVFKSYPIKNLKKIGTAMLNELNSEYETQAETRERELYEELKKKYG